ncbi:MAG TPA: cysteine--tRNA ligase [Candidatus Aminicenantes bacterium]|nr:cysteine--tRNA ligase [Candidatus Aminicenantes bacterium]
MSLRVFNTLTSQKERFVPIASPAVGFYTCGPTVYDFAHLGNFRSYVAEDLIKRYLTYRGFRVRHVMNITDIDDKTIRKAQSENQPLNVVTERYIQAFYQDIKTLNILPADVYPRATQHIPHMQAMVDALLQHGHAYRQENSVYFRISSFPEYGRLSNLNPESLQSGRGEDSDEYDKENARDFVLWKGYRENEPWWDFHVGKGRPGWHLECSAMSMAYLGNHFDIHMGGVDNIFPHHENEIAQAECATGEPFVNYWLHIQHLIVDGEKMSKSLGNFFTLRDLVTKGHDPLSIRYLLLSTHYRKLLNFTFSALDQADRTRKRLQDFLFCLDAKEFPAGGTPGFMSEVADWEQRFRNEMDDDFNISGALGVFFEFIHAANRRLGTLLKQDIQTIRETVGRINSVLGVIREPEAETLPPELEALVQEREQARARKDFQQADAIRDQLEKSGIQLMDTPDGVKWKVIDPA